VDTTSAAVTDVADTGGTLSDMDFAGDGTLYAVNGAFGEIITISSEGMTSVFASGFLALDGIAVDKTEGRLLVANSDADILNGVDLAGGEPTNLGAFDFDSGYYPSGLVFDGVDTLLRGTGETSLTILAHKPCDHENLIRF